MKSSILFTVCISMIGVGTNRAWTSPALPHLKSSNSNFLITESQGTWMVSLLLIGDLISSIINPLFMDHFGRKCTILLFTIPAIISWLLIIFAEDYLYLYFARFLAGFHLGSTVNAIVIYVSEISQKDIRGTLVNIIRTAASLGYFICSAIAAFFPYTIWNIICLLIPIIFLTISFFLPETPYFYFMKNQDEEGLKCLMKLRSISTSKFLDAEINEIKLVILENRKSSKMALKQLFADKHNRRDLLILFLMFVIQLFSGILVVNFYTEEILSYSSTFMDPGIQVMIVTGINVIACASVTFVIDRFERGSLFLYSGFFCAISLGIIGLFFFMKLYLEADVSSITWLPLLGLVMYKVSYSLGMGPIPDIMMGELFPVDVRATAFSFVVVTTFIFCFLTAAGYEVLNRAAGIYTTFWLFTLSSILGPLFIYFVTPETMGKTLEEIQAMRYYDVKDRVES